MTGLCEEVWPPECMCGHDVVDHDQKLDSAGDEWLCAACPCDGYQAAADLEEMPA